jgi:hypothetical protein
VQGHVAGWSWGEWLLCPPSLAPAMAVQEKSSTLVESPFSSVIPVEVATMPSVRTVREAAAMDQPVDDTSTCAPDG